MSKGEIEKSAPYPMLYNLVGILELNLVLSRKALGDL